jgi:hypothetical protein
VIEREERLGRHIYWALAAVFLASAIIQRLYRAEGFPELATVALDAGVIYALGPISRQIAMRAYARRVDR